MGDGVVLSDFEPWMMPPLLELMATYYGRGDSILDSALHEWLYLRNPFGVAKAVWVPDGGGWVGFMALVPVLLERRCERLDGYFVVNVLVDPRQRGKGLFLKMIDAAVQLAKGEDAALIGHPNSTALRFWQRKRMHFHESLQPVLALPGLPWGGIRSNRVTSKEMLRDLGDFSATFPEAFEKWKVAAHPSFLEWRYLNHPIHHYDVQLLDFRGGGFGLQISRQVRFGARLLLDQFTDQANLNPAYRALPVPTICFLASSEFSAAGNAVMPLPWKKRIPVFLTNYSKPVASSEAAQLGLSPTDM